MAAGSVNPCRGVGGRLEWSVRFPHASAPGRACSHRDAAHRGRSFTSGIIMAQRQTLPVLPLRGTVIFPGLTAPIAAGRPGTLRAIEAALKGDRLVFAVAQRDNTDEPTPDILYSMGVIARI